MDSGADPARKLADLAARIDKFAGSRAPKSLPKAKVRRATAPVTSPRAKAVRRWFLAASLAWGFVIYLLIAADLWERSASVWELIFGFFFTLVVSLACYAISLFQWEMSKGVWGWLRRFLSRGGPDVQA